MKKPVINKVLLRRVGVIVIAVLFCAAVVIWVGIDLARSRQGEPQGLARILDGEIPLSSGGGESSAAASTGEPSGAEGEGSEAVEGARAEDTEGTKGTDGGDDNDDRSPVGGVGGNQNTTPGTGGVWVDTSHWETVMVAPAWDEPIWDDRTFCNECGADITGQTGTHGWDVHGHPVGWNNKTIQVGSIHHDAIYEDRWIAEGHWE